MYTASQCILNLYYYVSFHFVSNCVKKRKATISTFTISIFLISIAAMLVPSVGGNTIFGIALALITIIMVMTYKNNYNYNHN